jgi:site-specific recombinase XerD
MTLEDLSLRPEWDPAYVSSDQKQANQAAQEQFNYQPLNKFTFSTPDGLSVRDCILSDRKPRRKARNATRLKSDWLMKKKLFITEGRKYGNKVIWLQFAYNESIIERAKNLGARWDPEAGGWWIAYAPDLMRMIHKSFYDCIRVERQGPLKAPKPKQKTNRSKTSFGAKAGASKTRVSKTGRKMGISKLSKTDKDHLRNFVKYLRGKMLSENTVKVYYFHMLDFLIYLNGKPTQEINNRDAERFREDVCLKRRYAVSTHRQVVSAMKQFKAYFPDCQINDLELERPTKQKFLPTVLSQGEVVRLLQVTKNIKHRTILALLYSSGLRIGELLSLEIRDIDPARRQIFVRRGKGKKDRYVLMAESFGILYRNYMMTYRPEKYFVEGSSAGSPYSASSVRSFLHAAVRQAGIRKRVTPHTLRHSYATHLLEQGVDLRYIQTLLGHSKPETTMVYTHVATKDIMKISSPLDVAIKKLSEHNQGPTPTPDTSPYRDPNLGLKSGSNPDSNNNEENPRISWDGI